jgi:putative chitinase
MNVTNGILVDTLGVDPFVAVQWNDALNDALAKFEINTPKRVAAFLAQVIVESNGFADLVENLNYSAVRLAQVWPGRYAENPHAAQMVPNQKAYELANNPQALANDVYANRLGNGAPSTKDGWNFRGQGPIQSTGRANAQAAKDATGIDFVSDPSQFQQPEGGSASAAHFFASNGCNELADAGDINAITQKVNGAPACAANQGPKRASLFNAAVPLLEAVQYTFTTAQTAPAPSTPAAKVSPKVSVKSA